MKTGLLTVGLFLLAAPTWADIIEWRDENGVRHFTNMRAEVPGEYREAAQVIYPLVTTSFDQGRSRHLTLRMLLQEQFAVDRAGPYMFVERLIPPFGYVPMGPQLSPILARGLPNSVPLTARVITR